MKDNRLENIINLVVDGRMREALELANTADADALLDVGDIFLRYGEHEIAERIRGSL